MKEKVIARVGVLSDELERLVGERQECLNRLQEIEVRVHQLVGSIQELHSLLNEEGPEQEALTQTNKMTDD